MAKKRMLNDMVQIILRLIVTVILLMGVVLVYDARIFTKKAFDFGNQNEATSGLKILGTLFAIIGGLIFFFCK